MANLVRFSEGRVHSFWSNYTPNNIKESMLLLVYFHLVKIPP